MKSVICTTLLLLIFSITNAQKPPVKFGDIPEDQLKMTRYESDSSAAAVILADYGESTISYSESTGFTLNFERIKRIKILSKNGLDWANFSIPLYHEGTKEEKLIGLKASTYNFENGKKIESKLKPEGIFKEKSDANLDMVKVTLPNVKEGSIVDITYKVKSDFLFNFQDWEFQSTIPTLWSEYRANIPEYFNYEKFVQGYVPLSINETKQNTQSINFAIQTQREVGKAGIVTTSLASGSSIQYTENNFRWAAQNIKAFKTEPFITTYRDYISKINFELSFYQLPNQPITPVMGSWEDINKRFSESTDFGGEVRGNGFLKKTVDELCAEKTTPEEKIAAVYQFVIKNIEWDGTSRTVITSSLRKVMDAKKGNSAEINLLLASMLEKADLPVSPVLLSTRDHGFLRETVPVSSQFNYVICLTKLNDKYLLLDATDPFLPLGMLPERCLNGKGFVVSKEGYDWVKLQSPVKTKTVISTELAMTNAGELQGNLQIERTGYDAFSTRKRYFSEGEPDYLKKLIGSRSWELTKSEFENANEPKQPFKEKHSLIISDHITSAGEMVYLNPFVMSRFEENPFKLETREYPVDFGNTFDKMYLFKIVLPENYAIEELPKSRGIALPNNAARYSYNVAQMGNTINVTSSLTINRNLFVQAEYPDLKEFYNQMIALQAAQIVCKKK